MRSTYILKIEICHDDDYNPVDHFVWYFSDEHEEPDYFVVYEEWSAE